MTTVVMIPKLKGEIAHQAGETWNQSSPYINGLQIIVVSAQIPARNPADCPPEEANSFSNSLRRRDGRIF
jgi:hypothetical protein